MNRLFEIFIKNHDNVTDPEVRMSYGKFAGIVGIITNSFLTLIKIITGILINSISILADGINNLTDATSSVITLVGFKLSALPEDKDHPYGHARIEYITGLIISVLVITVGIELGRSSIDKIIHPEEVTFNYIVVIILITAILLKLWQAVFYFAAGKKIDSTALKASGIDSRNDLVSTSLVLLGLIVSHYLDFNCDGYIGLLVSAFIIYSGIMLIKETSSPLLGEAPSEELVKNIRTIVESHDKVHGTHDLMVHNYGPGKVFASIHIEVNADEDILESHDLIDNIENEVYKKLKIQITGHMDPIKINDPIRNKVLEALSSKIDELDCVSNIHDLRIVPGPTHTNVIFDIVMEDGCKYTEKEILSWATKIVHEIDLKYFVVINFDKSYL